MSSAPRHQSSESRISSSSLAYVPSINMESRIKNVSVFLMLKLLQFWSWTMLYGSNGNAAISGKISYAHTFRCIIVI